MTKFGTVYGLAAKISETQNDDWDFPLVISGNERIGKSELGLLLQRKVAKLNGLSFSIDKNIAYDNHEVDEKIFSLPKKSGIQLDEPIRGLYKMDFNRLETRALVKIFAQIGVKNLFFTMTIPRMTDLVENLRNHRVKLWVHIVERGRAVLFEPDRNPFIGDPWHIKETLKAIGRRFMDSTISTDNQIALLGKAPTFIQDFKFPRLDDGVREAYQKFSTAKKTERTTIEKEDRYKEAFKKLVVKVRATNPEKYTYKELVTTTNIPETTIFDLITQRPAFGPR